MFEMFSLTLKEAIILFDNKYYSQIDGVAMGSPLGRTLANIFLCYYKSNWLEDSPKDFKPVYYKRYVDDIFVLFNKTEHAQFLLEHRNKKHKNMKFSIKTEINESLSFLDVKIFRENVSLEKKRLVGCTLFSSVLFHLSTSLVWYTPY